MSGKSYVQQVIFFQWCNIHLDLQRPWNDLLRDVLLIFEVSEGIITIC